MYSSFTFHITESIDLKCLALKRLEAPGCLKVGSVGGGDIQVETGGEGGGMGVEQSEVG